MLNHRSRRRDATTDGDKTLHDSDAPTLRRTPTGWLATSPPCASHRFAVAGATEQQALTRYWASYTEWREIESRPEPKYEDR
jgi:hypothetical protein